MDNNSIKWEDLTEEDKETIIKEVARYLYRIKPVIRDQLAKEGILPKANADHKTDEQSGL